MTKEPIWVRQGRPKPPGIGVTFHDSDVVDYALGHGRVAVYSWRSIAHDGQRRWTALGPIPRSPYGFATFAEAIAYADKEARRGTESN